MKSCCASYLKHWQFAEYAGEGIIGIKLSEELL
jgi:hypothetical protein